MGSGPCTGYSFVYVWGPFSRSRIRNTLRVVPHGLTSDLVYFSRKETWTEYFLRGTELRWLRDARGCRLDEALDVCPSPCLLPPLRRLWPLFSNECNDLNVPYIGSSKRKYLLFFFLINLRPYLSCLVLIIRNIPFGPFWSPVLVLSSQKYLGCLK